MTYNPKYVCNKQKRINTYEVETGKTYNIKTKDMIRSENNRPVALMNVHGRIFNKILANVV